MENNQTQYQYVTYKFYDEKGRRLAIFGIHNTINDTLDILTFTCSKKDIFTKKTAKELFNDYHSSFNEHNHKFSAMSKPILETVKVSNGKPKITFLDFCKFKYRRQRQRSIQIDFASGEKGFGAIENLNISKRKGKFVLDFIEKY